MSRISAVDRAELAELLARYAWSVDTENLDAALALFTEDGAFDGQSGFYAGRDEMTTFIREVIDGPRARGLQHWTANTVIEEISSEVVRMCSMSLGVRRIEREHVTVFVGFYIDDCVRVEGRWLFERRLWRPWEPEHIAAYFPAGVVSSLGGG